MFSELSRGRMESIVKCLSNLVELCTRDPCTCLSSGKQGEAPALPISWLTHLCCDLLSLVHVSSSSHWTRESHQLLFLHSQDWSVYSWPSAILGLMGSCAHLCWPFSLLWPGQTEVLLPSIADAFCISAVLFHTSEEKFAPGCFNFIFFTSWAFWKNPLSGKFSCPQGRQDAASYSESDSCVSWWELSYRLSLSSLTLSAHSKRGA